MAEEKKTVLFIVEGKSDKTALEKIFKVIYKRNRNIDFKFTDGDISSDFEIAKEDVENRIYEIVSAFMKDKKLNKSDIYQIVQIFDMDGTYIPESAIEIGEEKEFIYTLTNIFCNDVERVKIRNSHKQSIMNFLLTVHEIKGIPYEMYFMSCNLDHALYDKMNLDENLKQEYADRFYEMFIGKERLFIDFLNSDVVNGVPDTMTGSWRYIKEGVHSLERHTNLHIYFMQHPLPDGLL